MRGGGGKQKGGEFERQICKKLSLWISNNSRDDIFWRSAMSGGRASVKFKKGEKNLTQSGDISAIDPLGDTFIKKFIVECKAYKNLYLENLIFDTSQSGIIGFWDELLTKTQSLYKLPFLIAKQNHKKSILLTNYTVKHILTNNNYNLFILGVFPKQEIVIYDFEEFLSVVDPIVLLRDL